MKLYSMKVKKTINSDVDGSHPILPPSRIVTDFTILPSVHCDVVRLGNTLY